MTGVRSLRWALVAGIVASLVACTGPDPVTAATRSVAKATVADVASRRFPGVPVTPISDCVIDNASAAEILTLARAAGAADAQAAGAVADVLSRPATIDCLVADGLPQLLTRL